MGLFILCTYNFDVPFFVSQLTNQPLILKQHQPLISQQPTSHLTSHLPLISYSPSIKATQTAALWQPLNVCPSDRLVVFDSCWNELHASVHGIRYFGPCPSHNKSSHDVERFNNRQQRDNWSNARRIGVSQNSRSQINRRLLHQSARYDILAWSTKHQHMKTWEYEYDIGIPSNNKYR